MRLNLIHAGTSHRPNYSLSGKEFSIDYHYMPHEEVVIIGRIDPNYHFFEARASLKDTEKISSIYKDLMADQQDHVRLGTLHHLGYTYSGRLSASLISNYVGYWDTYTGLQIKQKDEHSGGHFAYFLQRHYREQVRKAELRDRSGSYVSILENYQAYLKTVDYMAYEGKVEPLRQILEQEAYVLLSQNEELVQAYKACLDLIGSLYNTYQTAIL